MSQIRTWKHLLLLSISILSWAFSPAVSSAQTPPCGNIIGPESIYVFGGNFENIVTKPIDNCEDPFNVTLEPASPYTLKIDGVDIDNGDVYIQNDPIQSIDIEGTGEFNYIESFLFKHVGNDYVFINQQTPTPTIDDYREFASTYFVTEEETEHYIAILIEEYETGNIDQYFFDEFGELLIDENTNDTIAQRYNDFKFAADSHFSENTVTYEPGVYTVLIKESLLIYTQDSFWKKLQKFFINTAHAESDLGPHFYTITFTVASESTGASSVLFLPGIQASRLYASDDQEDVSKNEQLWEPSNNDAVRALEMDDNGQGLYEIYANGIIDSVEVDLLFGYKFNNGNIYKDFSLFLNQLKTEGTIADWESFAYDWRYDVFDIVKNGTKINEYGDSKYLFNIVDELAKESYSKKVTIIAHSNGGLLAKALMYQLKSLGHEDWIDQIIFIGTPHLGTPKAMGTLLHGFDQEHAGGFVVKATNARKIMNNMPGVYSLLPSEEYFNTDASGSVVVTEDGVVISSFQDYKNYLVGNNRESSLDVDIKTPVRANSILLDNALQNHKEKLDLWTPASTTKISSIVGVGIPTMRGMYYDDIQERLCDNLDYISIACVVEEQSTPMATLSSYGDGTVMMTSAEGVNVGDKFYVDLAKISIDNVNKGKNIINHANITESLDVQNLIHNLILSVTDMQDNENISKTRPVINGKFTIQKIASPVQISSTDTEGRVTGVAYENNNWVLKKEIPNSDYFEFADVRYLVTPQAVDVETVLDGDGYGGYSYYVDDIDAGGHITNRISIIDATTTPNMLASISFKDISKLSIDEDEDGYIDAIIETANGHYSFVSEEEGNFDGVEDSKKRRTSSTLIKNKIGSYDLLSNTIEIKVLSDEEYRQALINILEQLVQVLNKLLILKTKTNN
jgi:hypothetical protein